MNNDIKKLYQVLDKEQTDSYNRLTHTDQSTNYYFYLMGRIDAMNWVMTQLTKEKHDH